MTENPFIYFGLLVLVMIPVTTIIGLVYEVIKKRVRRKTHARTVKIR